MKVTPLPIVPLVLLALVVLGTTRRAQAQAQDEKMFPLPTNSEAVDRAVSAENLRAVAAKTQDAQVLLGLTYLAQTGDPVRAELAERAVAANPEYAPIVAVLAAMMDGVDEQTVAALLERDPENALGHYLNGLLLYKADNDAEALAAFRKAAGLRELRLYLSQTSEALFAALDALGLQGRERLAALSWMALRSYNFGAIGLQPLQRTLVELPREMDNAGRREVSDMLIVFAGHLFRTNYHYRTYGRWSLESAFRLKTEVAAAAGRRSTEVRMPPEVAGILPSHINFAFARTGPREPELYNVKRDVPEADRPAFEQARRAAIEASETLIAAAAKETDATMGAYLRGIPEPPEGSRTPWASQWTPVERAMEQFPDVYRAALAYQTADDALTAAGDADPPRRNFARLMPLGLGIVYYAARHDKQFPPNLEVLYEEKLVEPEVEPRSVFTGRPFIYTAAGERIPEKSHEAATFIILYDDHEIDGNYQCIMADGHGEHVPVEKVREQLRARGK